MEESKEFPEYFPNGCPPFDAVAKEVLAYRLTKNQFLTEDDFKSYHELGIKPKYPDSTFMIYGISLSTDVNTLKKLKKTSTYTKSFDFIHQGLTYTHEGLVKIDYNKKHITWWLYKYQYPHKHFTLLGSSE